MTNDTIYKYFERVFKGQCKSVPRFMVSWLQLKIAIFTKNKKYARKGLMGLNNMAGDYLTEISNSKEYKAFKQLKENGYHPSEDDKDYIAYINRVTKWMYDKLVISYDAAVKCGFIVEKEQG